VGKENGEGGIERKGADERGERENIVFPTIFKVLSKSINGSAPCHVEGCVMKAMRYGEYGEQGCLAVYNNCEVRKRCRKEFKRRCYTYRRIQGRASPRARKK